MRRRQTSGSPGIVRRAGRPWTSDVLGSLRSGWNGVNGDGRLSQNALATVVEAGTWSGRHVRMRSDHSIGRRWVSMKRAQLSILQRQALTAPSGSWRRISTRIRWSSATISSVG